MIIQLPEFLLRMLASLRSRDQRSDILAATIATTTNAQTHNGGLSTE